MIVRVIQTFVLYGSRTRDTTHVGFGAAIHSVKSLFIDIYKMEAQKHWQKALENLLTDVIKTIVTSQIK